jgi:hypothetical protein
MRQAERAPIQFESVSLRIAIFRSRCLYKVNVNTEDAEIRKSENPNSQYGDGYINIIETF